MPYDGATIFGTLIGKLGVLRIECAGAVGQPSEETETRTKWSRWRRFPDPERGGYLIAPFGPGLYDLRLWDGRKGLHRDKQERGGANICAARGSGTRRNIRKRTFVSKHLIRLRVPNYRLRRQRRRRPYRAPPSSEALFVPNLTANSSPVKSNRPPHEPLNRSHNCQMGTD
jgi:hypothetical protein